MNAITTLQAPALERFIARAKGDVSVLRGGLPTRAVEAWHYTSLRDVAKVPFEDAPDADLEAARALIDAHFPADLNMARAVFVNGRFTPDLSTGLEAFDIAAFSPGSGAMARPERDAIAGINAALAQDGLTLRVPQDVDAGRLALITVDVGQGRFSTHPRHRIVLEDGAALSLLDLNFGSGAYLSNPVFEIVVGERARLTHAKVQDEDCEAFHLALVYADVATRGLYDSFTLTMGAALSRHEVHAGLLGGHAAVHVNAAQLLDGDRHADLTSVITHGNPDCVSRQTVKNVLLDASHSVFQGKIYVDRIAQKTDGYQMNQALLLSDRAQIDSKPELEIYADDVRCSHGATVGALDEEQIFYLQSRGIPHDDARAMLVRAFLTDAIALIEDEGMHTLLDAAVDAWWARRS